MMRGGVLVRAVVNVQDVTDVVIALQLYKLGWTPSCMQVMNVSQALDLYRVKGGVLTMIFFSSYGI